MRSLLKFQLEQAEVRDAGAQELVTLGATAGGAQIRLLTLPAFEAQVSAASGANVGRAFVKHAALRAVVRHVLLCPGRLRVVQLVTHP